MIEPEMQIDVTANRRVRKWSRREQAARVLWALVNPVFRFSPRPLWGWRRGILRLFGAQVGRGVHVYPTARIAMPWNIVLEDDCAIGDHVILYSLGAIHVGPRATVSQYAHLCAGSHNWRDPAMPLMKLPIYIGADVWVCAQAFIGPNVIIEENSIIGACAVITRNVPRNAVYAGNPARKINDKDQ